MLVKPLRARPRRRHLARSLPRQSGQPVTGVGSARSHVARKAADCVRTRH